MVEKDWDDINEQPVVAMRHSSYQKQQSIHVRHGYKSRLFPHWLKSVHDCSRSKFLSSFAAFLYCYERITFTWKKLRLKKIIACSFPRVVLSSSNWFVSLFTMKW